MSKIFFFFGALVLGVAFLSISFRSIFIDSASGSPDTVTFRINRGEGVKEVSARLSESRLITSDFWFRTYVWARNWEGRFQAGEYQLPRNLNLISMARYLVAGIGANAERQIKIIEGWSNREVAEYLETQGFGPKRDFLKLVARTGWQTRYQFFEDKPLAVDIEGYLFPDTYRVYNGAELEGIIVKVLDNFDSKLTTQLRRDIKKGDLNLHEVLTLASIIELEVKEVEDRRKVADVFLKRLKAGIPLQADSTVNYVTGKSRTRSSIDDIKIDSQYNTYKYKGLPPGPISNPGMDSIKAVIYPKANPFYYFLTTPDGQVLYGRTLDDHIKNRQYL